MNEQEVIGYSVYVGIDWADKKHDICICPRDSDIRELDVIRHCAKAIDAWVKDLHQRYGGRIAIAVELSKGPIVSALQKYDFIDLFPINPSTLTKYREGKKGTEGLKNNPSVPFVTFFIQCACCCRSAA